MNDYKMTPGELRATWGLGTVFFVAYAGHVYGSTSTDHIRYGATGRQRSINWHCDRHLRAGAGYLSNSLWAAVRPHWPQTADCRRTGGICRGQRHCRALPLNLGHYSGGERYKGPALLPPPSWRSCLTSPASKTVPKRWRLSASALVSPCDCDGIRADRYP